MSKRRKASQGEGHELSPKKLNGLTPTKKGKCDVSDEKNGSKEVVIEMNEKSTLLAQDEKDNESGVEASENTDTQNEANVVT